MIDEGAVIDTLDRIVGREGGYVDNPVDKGGPTKFGVTLKTLSEWRKGWQKDVTAEDVKALTIQEAKDIYRKAYVEQPGYRIISDPKLFDLVVDSAVNHGHAKATKMIQEALGVTQDGVLGMVTSAALGKVDAGYLYRKAVAARAKFYGRIISSDHSQAVFAAGWMNRLAEFIEA